MIPNLHGVGKLLLGDEQLLSGDFSISHDLNQSNGLIVEFNASGAEAVGFEARISSADGPQIERNLALRGTTQHGQSVSIDKLLIGNRNLSRDAEKPLHTTLTLLPRDTLHVGSEPPVVSQVRLFIPNVRFGGMARTTRAGGGSKLDSVLIKTLKNKKPVQMRLQQLPRYEDSIVSLRQSTGSEWTARFDVTSANGLGLDEVRSLADDFMLLLSFALSRRVMWVALKVMDPGVTYREVRYGTAVNLKAFPSSVMGDGALAVGPGHVAQHPLTEFLELALPSFWSLSRAEQTSLRQVIELMCESMERFFSPASITLLGRAFEILCHRFLRKELQYYLASRSQLHKKLKDNLRERLEGFKGSWGAVEKGEADEWARELDGSIKGLLTRPLVLQIGALLDEWLTTSNPYDPVWPVDFVRARNRAAHSSSIRENDAEAWIKGLALLSQLILKTLGYSGHYVNFYGDGTSESKWSELH